MPLPPSTTSTYRPARWRWIVTRLVLVVLIIVGSLSMILNRSSVRFGEGLSTVALDGVAPVLSAMRAPFEWVKAVSDEVGSYFFVHSRNRRLESKVARAVEIESQYRTILAENQRLKALLGIMEPKQDVVGAARIVGSTGGSYVRSAIILRGARDGVARGQPVRDPDGLVGQVIDVGRTSARILLLTDLASRVPVRVEGLNRTAIAAGTNGTELTLEFLSPGPPLKEGHRLVTSGDGGTFPPGIPVAIVTEPRGPHPRARPLSNPGGLDFVAILRPFVPAAVQSAVPLGPPPGEGQVAPAPRDLPGAPENIKPLPGTKPAPLPPAQAQTQASTQAASAQVQPKPSVQASAQPPATVVKPAQTAPGQTARP